MEHLEAGMLEDLHLQKKGGQILSGFSNQVTRDHFNSQNDNHIHLNDDHSFEFVTLPSNDVFFNGYNPPLFPIFNGGGDDGGRVTAEEVDSLSLHFQMRKLLISGEDYRRDSPSSSSSSSEVDELDGIPASTYCVWTPKSAQSVQASPNRCKKSNSTGSSASPLKRWKVLDLLRRSNSDGKNMFMFLKNNKEVKSENSKERRDFGSSNEFAGKKYSGGGEGKLPKTTSAYEGVYFGKRERRIKEKNKRRTYLPYKQNLIGYASTFNSFSPF
ncbi:PREDICTED: uncharacterized protein LOC109346919 [Lupinus angustifolius]|uniref:uncharacterized protein LOC109346919 n=1 Tax=Lupinus angustifolius TaxID=3871 RepID=UPI00092FC699|nr:PREDICTED: uncharacterized protein LOC109346919 [Lupinus angustifolius]